MVHTLMCGVIVLRDVIVSIIPGRRGDIIFSRVPGCVMIMLRSVTMASLLVLFDTIWVDVFWSINVVRCRVGWVYISM
jgi:hypothetical protein